MRKARGVCKLTKVVFGLSSLMAFSGWMPAWPFPTEPAAEAPVRVAQISAGRQAGSGLLPGSSLQAGYARMAASFAAGPERRVRAQRRTSALNPSPLPGYEPVNLRRTFANSP